MMSGIVITMLVLLSWWNMNFLSYYIQWLVWLYIYIVSHITIIQAGYKRI